MTRTLLDIGSATLYAEVAGGGPPLLLITGGTGDAGEWAPVAPALAQDFTVVTYDRRGMSRSPRPDGWLTTSLAEQADDAAGLLRELSLAPALVVGHSGGGSIACELLARHPEVVRHAVVYEPPLFAAVPEGERALAEIHAAVEPALAEHGHQQAMVAFMRVNAGDDLVDQVLGTISPRDRDRVLDNGAVFFPIELPVFASYLPDLHRVKASGVPMTVVVGEESRHGWAGATTQWLASGTGARLAKLPGGHVGFLTHPEEFVKLIRSVADAR